MHNDVKDYLVAGIDEAGRGPLAGPVVAGVVILNPRHRIAGLADSKQLTAKQRETLFDKIRTHALAWSAGRARVSEIDAFNILEATMLAMQRAVMRLPIRPQLAIIDGNRCPVLPCAAQSIIRGDETEPAISAASIVAKVLRDRLMCMLDKKYPHYGFAQHKGYPTEAHFHALDIHGPCRVHRFSFAPVAEARKKNPSGEGLNGKGEAKN